MTTENDAKGYFDNIITELQNIAVDVQSGDENTTVLMVGTYKQGEQNRMITSLIGNYKTVVRALAETIMEKDDIAEVIIDALALCISQSSRFTAKVIKVPSGSSIEEVLSTIINQKKNNKNNPKNDN